MIPLSHINGFRAKFGREKPFFGIFSKSGPYNGRKSVPYSRFWVLLITELYCIQSIYGLLEFFHQTLLYFFDYHSNLE